MAWKAVALTGVGASLPYVVRTFLVIAVKDFARRFSYNVTAVRIFDKVFGKILNEPIWSGIWRVTWNVNSKNFEEENHWDGQVYRCFDTIAADGIGITRTGKKIPYGFLGKLSRNRTILTGTWFDKRGSLSGYYGAYQIRLSDAEAKAEGKWIGFSSETKAVKANKITWERIGDKKSHVG